MTRHGVGVVGYGRVASIWHMPVYRRGGVHVVAVCDSDPAALRRAGEAWPDIRLYDDYTDLLADPEVAVVDLATRPAGRIDLIRQAVEAGRHVLAQKPLSAGIEGLAELIALADRRGVAVAVNQNGRFAPAWREADELLSAGAIGEIRTVTHSFDTNLRWLPDPRRHGTLPFLLFDYANHWIDVSAWWLRRDPVRTVQAKVYEVARYPDGGTQQSAWIAMETTGGVDVVIRAAGGGIVHAGHSFVVQGATGTLRGAVDSVDGEFLQVECAASVSRVPLAGEWFPDGFLGAMRELLDAVSAGRQPTHSLADNIRTVALVDAACASAAAAGTPVAVRFPDVVRPRHS